MKRLLLAFVSVLLVLSTVRPAAADPCGMVPPITVNDDGKKIERIGLQKTYVFYHRKFESIVIRPGFKGNVSEFGMLIPFPTPPELRKVPDGIFRHIAAAVDPPEVVVDVRPVFGGGFGGGGFGGGGFGGGLGGLGVLRKDEVKVIREEAVGMYEVAVIAAGSAKALNRWMKDHRYKYPAGMDAVCNDYIAQRWCFVAVRSKVALKKRVDPKPGQRAVDTKLPAGSMFDGHVQTLSFRFRSKKLVVPMRLSAFNAGSLRNVVYLLTDVPAAVRDLPKSFVRRQVSGLQLVRNLSSPLPLRVVGATRVRGRVATLPDGSKVRVRIPRGTSRDPRPHNGLAADLFVADMMAAKQRRLLLWFEATEKSLTQVTERLGLRDQTVDRMIRDASDRNRKRMLRRKVRQLKDMTLTVIDGDFPRDYIAKNNLRFTRYSMPRTLNHAGEYDANSAKPGEKKQGIRVAAMLHNEEATAISAIRDDDSGRRSHRGDWALIGLVSCLIAGCVGTAVRRRRRPRG